MISCYCRHHIIQFPIINLHHLMEKQRKTNKKNQVSALFFSEEAVPDPKHCCNLFRLNLFTAAQAHLSWYWHFPEPHSVLPLLPSHQPSSSDALRSATISAFLQIITLLRYFLVEETSPVLPCNRSSHWGFMSKKQYSLYLRETDILIDVFFTTGLHWVPVEITWLTSYPSHSPEWLTFHCRGFCSCS